MVQFLGIESGLAFELNNLKRLQVGESTLQALLIVLALGITPRLVPT
jgi:hypothetical protein